MSLLGIDIGTTGCKAGVFSEDGAPLARAYREYDMVQPRPGWAELDTHAVWDAVREVIREAAAQSAGDPVAALCFSSIGEAVVPVTKDREILDNSILCIDPRGAETAAALDRDFTPESFYAINPNLPGPQYSLPKMLWLREHRPEVFDRADYFLLWGDFAGFMLGAEPVTANSLANRTLLFDLKRNDWSDRLLDWAGLDRTKLGRVLPGGREAGTVSPAMAAELGLPPGVRIVTGGHDQCCNLLGCGCIRPGSAMCGMGSFECITPVFGEVENPGEMLRHGLNIEHHVLPDLHVSFLFNQSGLLVKWFRDTFARADQPPADGDVYALLNAELPPEPTSLLVLPHFVPPVFPRHIPDTAGAILGLHANTTRGEILKAIMECSTLYFVETLEALRGMGLECGLFAAPGGGAKSDAWLQIKADILGAPFQRPVFTEAGVLGAAMLAGLGTGRLASPEEAVARFVAVDRVFTPDPARHARYREKHALYAGMFPALRPLLRRMS